MKAGRVGNEAEEFLRDFLFGGPMLAKEGEDHARALGIAPRALKRARKKLWRDCRKERGIKMRTGLASVPAEEGRREPKSTKPKDGTLRG